MLSDEERDRIADTLTDEPFTGPDHPMWAEVDSIVRAARAQELRDAADLIAVTKFNDPFGVNREAWKLLRDRADRLDATDQLQDPKD